MAKLVSRGNYPAPEALRRYALSRFTTSIMVESYCEVYKYILRQEKHGKDYRMPAAKYPLNK